MKYRRSLLVVALSTVLLTLAPTIGTTEESQSKEEMRKALRNPLTELPKGMELTAEGELRLDPALWTLGTDDDDNVYAIPAKKKKKKKKGGGGGTGTLWVICTCGGSLSGCNTFAHPTEGVRCVSTGCSQGCGPSVYPAPATLDELSPLE